MKQYYIDYDEDSGMWCIFDTETGKAHGSFMDKEEAEERLSEQYKLLERGIKLLHIYAQEQWHDNAFIIGNRAGLELLRDTITAALKKGTASTDKETELGLFTSDGEGYEVGIICDDSEWQESFWTFLSLPYTDKIAENKNDTRILPRIIWMEREYLQRIK